MFCTNCAENISDKAEVCPKCGVRQFRVTNYCSNCGVNVNENQEMCTNCGVLIKKSATVAIDGLKEPWLMALLSFIITGLGQMILGQIKKGAVMLIGSIALGIFTVGFSFFITTPIAIIDAFLIAKKMKEGKEVGEWEFF